jgi:predicted lipoprotein
MRTFLCLVLAVLAVSCTVVRNDAAKTSGLTESEEAVFGFANKDFNFDPAQYANAICEPVVLPRIESLSVEYKELMAGLEADESGTLQKYGYRKLEEGNHFNFAVKGTVKILSIDTTSMNGVASLDFAPFDGQADCLMSIGPIFRGATIRDIQDTISINDFVNQVEFARLARELNNKVRDVVLKDIDFSHYIGAEAELLGVFTYEGRGRAFEIMPINISFNME